MANSNMLNTQSNDITVNSVRIGLGPGAVSTSTMVSNGTTGAYSGANNTVIGYQAGKSLSTGAGVTAIGSGAAFTQTTTSNTTYIGYNAGLLLTGGNGTVVGSGAQSNASGAFGGTVFGYNAGLNNVNAGCAFGESTLTVASSNANTAVGYECLKNCTANNNVGLGYQALTSHSGGVGYNVGVGSGTGGAGAPGSVALTTGTGCLLLGYQAGVNDANAGGTISLGANAVSDIATGSTSATNGPGIAIGSASYPVGFRGDGTLYPTATAGSGTLPLTFTGYWRVKINGTYYKIPLYLD